MKEKIFGYLDFPSNGTKIFSPFLNVSGWAFSNIQNDLSIKIFVDNNFEGETSTSLEREDVVKDHPNMKNANNSGFWYRINLEKYKDGTHTVKIFVKSNDEIQFNESKFELLNSKQDDYTNTLQKDHLNRWKKSEPNSFLTWGEMLTGDAFIDLAKKYDLFSSEKSILELGPGYGRILSSIISKNIPFKSYTGLDLSENNIKLLQKKFEKNNINFVQGDFTKVSLDSKYDIVLSSLTLKHQYPTFSKAIKNISKFLNMGGILFFDVLENKLFKTQKVNLIDLEKFGSAMSTVEDDGVFVAHYNTSEVSAILESLSYKIINFDHVTHSQKKGDRLVVIAKKE